MKRKETLFEQKLIKYGWKLSYKGYDEKTSQKVVAYHYGKEFGLFDFRVVLDRKREKVLDIYFFTPFITINRETKKLIYDIFNQVEKELGEVYLETLMPNGKVESDDNELVETLEAIEQCE